MSFWQRWLRVSPGHPQESTAVAVNLAVRRAKFGGDGWESNPPRTPQQRPANGFEDRGEHQLPYIPVAGLGYPRFSCAGRIAATTQPL